MEQDDYIANVRWLNDDDCGLDELEKKVEKAELLGEQAMENEKDFNDE